MTQADTAAQGGLEQVAGPDRVASLTGIRAVAALLVVATHAAYTTGKYNEGYFGLVCGRMEMGVPIFNGKIDKTLFLSSLHVVKGSIDAQVATT